MSSKKEIIEGLLREKQVKWKYSYREIGRLAGVSHVYVLKIARGLGLRKVLTK